MEYERLKTAPLEPILELARQVPKPRIGWKTHRTEVMEVPVHLTSLRLQTFAHHGTRCVGCGMEATHFAFERALSQVAQDPGIGYHLNLYGVNEAGEEVIFTHDHIIPRSKGGKDSLGNTQTMCGPCNWRKADE